MTVDRVGGSDAKITNLPRWTTTCSSTWDGTSARIGNWLLLGSGLGTVVRVRFRLSE